MERLAAWLLLPLAVGCNAAADGADDFGGEPHEAQAALVHIERHESSGSAVVRYARAAHVDRDSLRITGGVLEAPPLGQCAPLDAQQERAPRPVELVAAGPTTVWVGAERTELLPRLVPDVSDWVSGTVYSRTLALGSEVLRLELAGLDEPLSVELPEPLADLRLDGRAVDAQASVVPLEGSNGALRLSWTEPSASQGMLWLDVLGHVAMRCHVDDRGEAELERSWLGEQGALVLRRVLHSEHEHAVYQRVVLDAATTRTIRYRLER